MVGRGRRGQTTAEWAVLMVAAIAAFLGIQILLKQTISGSFQRASDQISIKPYYHGRTASHEAFGITSERLETVQISAGTGGAGGAPDQTTVRTVIDPQRPDVIVRNEDAQYVDDLYAPLQSR